MDKIQGDESDQNHALFPMREFRVVLLVLFLTKPRIGDKIYYCLILSDMILEMVVMATQLPPNCLLVLLLQKI